MYVSRTNVTTIRLFVIMALCVTAVLFLQGKKAAAASSEAENNSVFIVNSVSDGSESSSDITAPQETIPQDLIQEPAPEPVFSFTDVEEGYWAFDAAQNAAKLGLVSEGKFLPHNYISAVGFIGWLTKAGIQPKVELKLTPGQLLRKQDVVALLGTSQKGKSTWYGLEFPDKKFHANYLDGIFKSWEVIPTYLVNAKITRAEAAFIIQLLTYNPVVYSVPTETGTSAAQPVEEVTNS